MTLENQVTSLELSKQLKALGFPQDSLFYWVHYNVNEKKGEPENWNLVSPMSHTIQKYDKICSAYTVAELGELIPKGRAILLSDDGWFTYKERELDFGMTNMLVLPNSYSEAEARGEFLKYLKENNLV